MRGVAYVTNNPRNDYDAWKLCARSFTERRNYMRISYKNEKLQRLQEQESKKHIEKEVPDTFFQDLMDDQLGKGYLNRMPDPSCWKIEPAVKYGDYSWIRFERLPVVPGKEEYTSLLECWQSALSAMHTLNQKIALVILRSIGKTEIFCGVKAEYKDEELERDKLLQCLRIHMQGAEFSIPTEKQCENLEDFLFDHEASGMVMGIPSLRNANSGVSLQTMDKISQGIRIDGEDKSYALVILAEPVRDLNTVELMQTFLKLKSDIHQYVKFQESNSSQEGNGKSSMVRPGIRIGGILEGLALASALTGFLPGYFALEGARRVFSGAGIRVDYSWNRSENYSVSNSVSREYENFVVDYCEKLIDKNIKRLEQGRNLGFWNTGVYTLATDRETVDSMLGILRSVYSGSDSYIEPIRVFNTTDNREITDRICRLNMVPLPGSKSVKNEIGEILGFKDREDWGTSGKGWHILGPLYEQFTTALTTEELAISSNLPHREVAGLRTVKSICQFSSNAAKVTGPTIKLGKFIDMGIIQKMTYEISIDALVRHMLVTGTTGYGKSTTTKKIIKGVLENHIPVLVIEPAKDDYIRWAIEYNKTPGLSEKEKFRIIMPGVTEIDGVKPENLYLSPFQPASYKGAPVDNLQHSEQLAELLNAVIPSEDVVPLLIEETVYECMEDWLEKMADENGMDECEAENKLLSRYPDLEELTMCGEDVIARKTYAPEVKANFSEVLNTRFKHLKKGIKGKVLNNSIPVDFEELFDRPVVINLSKMGGRKNMAIIMALLLLYLYEYRESRFSYDEHYREMARENKLLSLVVLEEAHNILEKPKAHLSAGGNPQEEAAELFSKILSEIRAYGQGMVIVDQSPSKLIEDCVRNTNYKIAHKLDTRNDMEAMADAMLLKESQREMLAVLDTGKIIISSDVDSNAAWVKVQM